MADIKELGGNKWSLPENDYTRDKAYIVFGPNGSRFGDYKLFRRGEEAQRDAYYDAVLKLIAEQQALMHPKVLPNLTVVKKQERPTNLAGLPLPTVLSHPEVALPVIATGVLGAYALSDAYGGRPVVTPSFKPTSVFWDEEAPDVNSPSEQADSVSQLQAPAVSTGSPENPDDEDPDSGNEGSERPERNPNDIVKKEPWEETKLGGRKVQKGWKLTKANGDIEYISEEKYNAKYDTKPSTQSETTELTKPDFSMPKTKQFVYRHPIFTVSGLLASLYGAYKYFSGSDSDEVSEIKKETSGYMSRHRNDSPTSLQRYLDMQNAKIRDLDGDTIPYSQYPAIYDYVLNSMLNGNSDDGFNANDALNGDTRYYRNDGTVH